MTLNEFREKEIWNDGYAVGITESTKISEDFHEVLAKFTDKEDATDILYTYLQLHKDKIIGAHWLWCAIERVVAGESEESVLADYGYIRDGLKQN